MHKFSFCGHDRFGSKSASYIYQRDGKFLFLDRVPCDECQTCGQRYFDEQVLGKIQREFEAIYFKGKTARTVVLVPAQDYSLICG